MTILSLWANSAAGFYPVAAGGKDYSVRGDYRGLGYCTVLLTGEGNNSTLAGIVAAPNGESNAAGTLDSPLSLAAALSALSPGDTLWLLGGVYVLPTHSITLGTGGSVGNEITIKSPPLARPVFTCGDGAPAQIHVPSYTTLDGAWITGTKTDDRGFLYAVGEGVTIQNCVVINGDNGNVNNADDVSLQLLNNTFVNCGCWRSADPNPQQHGIYFAGSNGVTARGNIVIAHPGNGITCYHSPTNAIIDNNFIAAGYAHLISLSQSSGFTVTNNILWSSDPTSTRKGAIVQSADAAMDWSSNYYGPSVTATDQSPNWSICNSNNFSANAEFADDRPFGNNAATWTQAQIDAAMGYTQAQIDAAIDHLVMASIWTAYDLWQDDNLDAAIKKLQTVLSNYKSTINS